MDHDAGDNSKEANGNGSVITERKQLASVSTALLLAVGIGIFEGLALYFGSGVFLNLMGISSVSFTSSTMFVLKFKFSLLTSNRLVPISQSIFLRFVLNIVTSKRIRKHSSFSVEQLKYTHPMLAGFEPSTTDQ